MKKSGFTMLEVMLSIILFSLMVGAILGSYTSIQRANMKMANTQNALNVAENFLEMVSDATIEYEFDMSHYSDADYEQISYWKIINTGNLYLKSRYDESKTLSFYQENISGHNKIYMSINGGSGIDLVNSDTVNVDALNFEIYPENSYVNVSIRARVLRGESLYKSGISLSTTLGFKEYLVYPGEITVETLCEDVCTINQVTGNSVLQNVYLNMMHGDDNVTMNSCTLGFGAGHSDTLLGYLGLLLEGNSASESIFQTAKDCKNSSTSWCNNHCSPVNEGNPYNCGYIRYQMLHGFTGTTCDDYNLYVRDYACQDMCEATIFSCLDDGNDNSIIRRTGIKVTSGEYVGKYLQNPKEYIVEDNNTYKKGSWTSTNGWTGCKEYKRYKDWGLGFTDCEYFAGNQYCQCLLQSSCSEVGRKCTKGYYYCDGEYYGGGNSTGVEFLLTAEYNYACVKWINSATSDSNYSSKRIVYTPETNPDNTLGDCVCEVNYVYSPFAGGFIENGAFAGIQKVDSYTYSESIFMYKQRDYDMIYVDEYTGGSWPLDGVKKWLSTESDFVGSYCNNNELCAKAQTYSSRTNFNGVSYNVINTGGFFKLNTNINFKDFKCNNQTGFDACVSTGCCPEDGELVPTYSTKINFDTPSAKQYYCEHYLTGKNGIYGVWSGSACRIINELRCDLLQSGFNVKSIVTGTAQGYYCNNVLHNIWDGSKCLKDQGVDCLSGDTKTFGGNTAREYYCPNNYPGYVYSGTTGGCIKCIATGVNYSNFTFNEDDTKEYYCESVLGYLWTILGCRKGFFNYITIDYNNAKKAYCTGHGYVRSGSNCLVPNGSICTNYDKKPTPSDDDVNKYYCVNNFPGYEWDAGSCKKCLEMGTVYVEETFSVNDALKSYCTGYLTGFNGVMGIRSGNKCNIYIGDYCADMYTGYDTITIDNYVAREYYCRNVKHGYRDTGNNTCYDTTIYEMSCRYKYGDGSCPVIGGWTVNDAGYCVHPGYDDCVASGKGKNIYKDYTYTCDISITQQSNSILNIMESLSNLGQELTGNVISGLPWWIRWAF